MTVMNRIIIFLSTGGLIGYAPIAPGTFGSLVALPFCYLLSLLSLINALILMFIFIGLSIWIADRAEKIESQKDPKQVVIDEICGMAVALFALPFTPFFVICGFALFRVFDILKPFPIRWVDKRTPGGFGIVLDDLIAGIITNIVIRSGIALMT